MAFVLDASITKHHRKAPGFKRRPQNSSVTSQPKFLSPDSTWDSRVSNCSRFSRDANLSRTRSTPSFTAAACCFRYCWACLTFLLEILQSQDILAPAPQHGTDSVARISKPASGSATVKGGSFWDVEKK